MMATTVRRRGRPEVIDLGAPADLEQALHDLGIEITKADDDEVWALCPMHAFYTGREDNHASWSINRTSGVHSDFSCPYKGNFITLVCDMLEVGPFEAARWIKQYGLNMEQIENLPEYEERKEKRRRNPLEVTEQDLAEFSNPPPEALAVRQISAEAAKHYGILWDPDKTEWILPVRMPDGRLIGWQRKGEKRLRRALVVAKNWPMHMAKSLTLFGADVFPIGHPAVVQESPLDCARLLTAGIEGGVSTMGDKFSDEQMRVLRDLTDEVVWASDNDDAGRAAARIFCYGDPTTNRPAWSRRFRARYLNYGMIPEGCKDIGGEVDIPVDNVHIQRAVSNAQHELLANLGGADGVQRTAPPVPAANRGKDGRARKGAGSRRAGSGKVPNGNRRRGGTTRGIR